MTATITVTFSLPVLYLTLGVLIGLAIGYALGWLLDPYNPPRMLVRAMASLYATNLMLVMFTQFYDELASSAQEDRR